MTETTDADRARDMTPNAAALKTLISFLATLLVTAGLLFGGAGRLDWGLGWLFAAVWILPKLGFLALLRWRHPELLVERSTRHADTRPYDRPILAAYFVLAFGTFLVAGLDGGRFQWSGQLPAGWIAAGYVIYLLGNGLAGWAMNSNPYFSSESRLQAERGQRAVSSGPYQYVRHPAYLATLVLWPVAGPMLSSWWAVIPGVGAALTMVIRTALEDRMLTAELDGYAEYAGRVRYRLVPGVW